jgi:glycosyltransferase involved in cell wall biosynthesis
MVETGSLNLPSGQPTSLTPLLPTSPPRVLFVSANAGGGGSEELWVQTASRLKSDGVPVQALTTWSSRAEARVTQLEKSGVPHASLIDSFADKVLHRLSLGTGGGLAALRRHLQAWKPALVVFNSGTSLDGLSLLQVIADAGIPFVALTHLVSTDNWPDDKMAEKLLTLYGRALRACFVSEHNLRFFETQTGGMLGNSQFVRNPYLVSREQVVPWPAPNGEILKLAFPARIHPRTKGHDLLIDVLSEDRWRARPVEVSFFGKGPWQNTLCSHISQRSLNSVKFHGHVSDVEGIWRTHHALILPSRHEGLPICVVEAMIAGRPCIVNPAGGSAEFVEDGRTGFVSTSCSAKGLDEAMERAWQARSEWPQMGEAAAKAIRANVPVDPARTFADQLLGWLSERM